MADATGSGPGLSQAAGVEPNRERDCGSVDRDGQEPRAESTRSALPVPPGAQCGLLHDVHRLVGAVAHVAGEQEGRMAHLAEGGLERARFIVFDLVCPGSWTLHDTSDHSPRSICLIERV